ncbi:MAG: metal-sulfur cluster assembly factor [Acidobacteriales bacterium]|nr:metal-sulfur cluster assembly factor [Terriglobales bacterium]
MAVTEQDVLTMLKQCYDPEIPVNIVDLGLIYGINIRPAAEPDLQEVVIDMTMTSPGCPAHASIGQDVKDKVEQLPGVKSATVNVVWNPPWSPERLSEEARRTLGIEVEGA